MKNSNTKSSAYWREEIEKTQAYLSELVHGELAGVKSTKSLDDSISLQEIDKEIKKCKSYIAYCEKELDKALALENGETPKNISILYFKREYGY